MAVRDIGTINARYLRMSERLRRLTLGRTARAWVSLGSWDRRDLARWLDRVVPLVDAGKLEEMAATQAQIASIVQAVLGRETGAAVDVRAAMAAIRGGVPTRDVYARPMHQLWGLVGEGRPWVEAHAAAGTRLAAQVQTDLTLASREVARQLYRGEIEIVGHRRVLVGDSCRLCVQASTRLYKVGDLQPIHGRCNCRSEPVFRSHDPGAPAAPADDGRTPVAFYNHGEYGPAVADAAGAYR